MTFWVPNTQMEVLLYGQTATKSWTLPGSATTQTLFTVSTGNVLVTSLFGIVTTLIGSTATTLALGTAPTTGTLKTNGIATATAVTSAEVGTWITPVAASGVAGALAVGSNAGASVFPAVAFTAAPGTITATTSANAGAGVINWYLTYVAIDAGASVA